jgi:hypothetical protein
MSWHAGWCGLGWTRIPVLFSLYVNDILIPPSHVELLQCAYDTPLVPTSCNPSLLVGYLVAYLGRFVPWLRDCRFAINVSKSIAALFVKAARSTQKHRAVQFLGEPIQRVETTRHIGVTIKTQLTWSAQSTRRERRQLRDWACLAPSLTREAACPSETVCCSTRSSSVL